MKIPEPPAFLRSRKNQRIILQGVRVLQALMLCVGCAAFLGLTWLFCSAPAGRPPEPSELSASTPWQEKLILLGAVTAWNLMVAAGIMGTNKQLRKLSADSHAGDKAERHPDGP